MPVLFVICAAGAAVVVLHGLAKVKADTSEMLDIYGALLEETREIQRQRAAIEVPTPRKPRKEAADSTTMPH